MRNEWVSFFENCARYAMKEIGAEGYYLHIDDLGEQDLDFEDDYMQVNINFQYRKISISFNSETINHTINYIGQYDWDYVIQSFYHECLHLYTSGAFSSIYEAVRNLPGVSRKEFDGLLLAYRVVEEHLTEKLATHMFENRIDTVGYDELVTMARSLYQKQQRLGDTA